MKQKKLEDIIRDVKASGKKIVTLITHDGQCHADDVYCTALLQILFRKVGLKTKVLRTRDESVAASFEETNDNYVCYDVFGGILDHHNTMERSKEGFIRPLAAIGRLWRFGRGEFIKYLGIDEQSWKGIDSKFIAFIDQTDCLGSSVKVNPCTYLFNHYRDSTQDSSESWKKSLGKALSDWKYILQTEENVSKLRPVFNEFPVKEINGKKFKIMSNYVPPVGNIVDIDGLIWATDKGLRVRLLKQNKLDENVGLKEDDIIFQNDQWMIEVKSVENIYQLKFK